MDKPINNEIKCGIIMPISSIDGCSTEHWAEVKSIFEEATCGIEGYMIKTFIVSEAEESGIIQKRIVQNLYNSDLVICDVSAKNPNVMFELGMRLAFDKPTIIVKDDKTDYSFDTGVIEHLSYPRDLRFSKIVEFKRRLSSKIVATYEESKRTADYSSFLKSFGQFKVATLEEKEVSADAVIFEALNDLRIEMAMLRSNVKNSMGSSNARKTRDNYFPPEAIVKATNIIYDFTKELSEVDLKDEKLRRDLYDLLLTRLEPKQYFHSGEEFRYFFEFVLNIVNIRVPSSNT